MLKKKITQELKDYKNKFIIIKIPVVSAVVYGRKVGYKIRKINLPMNIEKISATMIIAMTNSTRKIVNQLLINIQISLASLLSSWALILSRNLCAIGNPKSGTE